MQTRRRFLTTAAGVGLAALSSPFLYPMFKSAHAGRYRFIFRDSEAAIVTFRTNSEHIRKVVPKPFQPNKDRIMRVWIARDRRVEPKMLRDETLKAFVAVPATHKRTKGLYIDKFYVETIFAASWIQDVYGYPSEYAKISLSRNRSSIKSKITKGDTQIARINLSLTGAVTPRFEEDVIHFTALGAGEAARLGMTENLVEEVERIPGRLEQADLFGLEVKEVLEAAYVKFNKKMGHPQSITE